MVIEYTKRKEYFKQYREKNKDKLREAVGRWQKKNPTKRREYARKHYYKKLGKPVPIRVRTVPILPETPSSMAYPK